MGRRIQLYSHTYIYILYIWKDKQETSNNSDLLRNENLKIGNKGTC